MNLQTYDDKLKVQIICLFYARLKSSDLRRRKIMSKYRELEVLTGINANTIRQWADSFDPYFDNDRRGYYQRDLERANQNLYSVYVEYSGLTLLEHEKLVDQLYYNLSKGSFSFSLDDKKVNLYSIKTKKEESATTLFNIKASSNKIDFNIKLDGLNRYKPGSNSEQILLKDDLVFLTLGGDNEKWKKWENGLTAIGKIREIIVDNNEKNYEVIVNVFLKLPTEITPQDLLFYPQTVNEFNIGPSLRGTPNQAINRVTAKGALSILRSICDIFPEYSIVIEEVFGKNNYQKILTVPLLQTRGEYEEIRNQEILEIDFEGSEDLIDKVNVMSDNQERVITQLSEEEESFESDKKELMVLSTNELKRKLPVTRRENSISDIKKIYDRFIEYQNDYLEEYSLESKEAVDYSNLEDSLILEPEFQRDYVWSRKKKIELIDSIIMGVPLPTFYFSIDKNGNLLVVDGKQRISSILEFITGKLTLPNSYRFLCLDQEKESEVSFSDLISRVKRKFEDFTLTCYLVDSSLIPRLQNEIFMRVNRGGEKLTAQEIRNATNTGRCTYLLNKISNNGDLAFVSTNRKRDQYLVLRFIAVYLVKNNTIFNQIYDFEKNYTDMDDLLDRTMKFINILDIKEVDNLYKLYMSYFLIAKEIFDTNSYKPFSRIDSNAVNMIIFETWMTVLSYFDIIDLKNNMSQCFKVYEDMVVNDDFIDNILFRRDYKDKVRWRLDFIEEIVEEIGKVMENKDE
ncbi:TPA: DUF262 domain-containing protein [Streptococcus suis]|nr:DUF262 domain-containing protein [Streptococcus suis]